MSSEAAAASVATTAGEAAQSTAASLEAAGDLREFHVFAVGERDAMSVNMRNAGLEQLNDKYMSHLRSTMRRELSLIGMEQRSVINRFNTYSMTMVADSLASINRDRRSYLQYLKARHQRQEDFRATNAAAAVAAANAASAGSGEPPNQPALTRARTFIDSQRVATAGRCGGGGGGASLARLQLLTRPSRHHQAATCPRLKAAPVAQARPEFAPNLQLLRGRNRVRTAPTPGQLLRLHQQRLETAATAAADADSDDEEDDDRDEEPSSRRLRRGGGGVQQPARANSTLGFSAHDARLRRQVLADSRFLQLRDSLVAAPNRQLQQRLGALQMGQR